jgi:osmotically-inducible protein OsmY
MAAARLAFTAMMVFAGGSVRAAEMDNRIESSFKKTFVYKTYLKDEHITISSEYGVVILTGTVADETHSPMAQDTAEALPGVMSVDNRIEVTGDRPAENSDAWLSMKVKTALLFHRSVSGTKTEVYVEDGIVTLKGEASSQAQKELTAEFAKDVEGVKGMMNEMTVATISMQPDETMNEKIDDASITAQVKMTLASHRSTSVLNTKVTTYDGIVTLRGTAKNDAEKDLVTKLITDIDGVRRVVNNMTIEAIVSRNN